MLPIISQCQFCIITHIKYRDQISVLMEWPNETGWVHPLVSMTDFVVCCARQRNILKIDESGAYQQVGPNVDFGTCLKNLY